MALGYPLFLDSFAFYAAKPRGVNRNIKLYSAPPGGIGILTKFCAPPQAFYGSRRLAVHDAGTRPDPLAC